MKLKDLIESNNTGLDAIKRAPIVDYDTGVRCIRIGDISNNRPFCDWGYTKVEANNYNKFQLKKGDIIVARTGATIGVNKYIDKDYKSVYNNGLIRIRVKEENNPKYIYYLLQSNNYKNFIKTISMGTSTQPNMQMNDLLNLDVPNFDRTKQDKIVELLGRIDQKIELNNEINNNLYELAMSHFNSLYKEENNTYEVQFGDIVSLLRDGTHNPPKRVELGIPLLTGQTIVNGFIDYEKMTYVSEEDYKKIHAKYEPIENDLVLTKIGTVGKVGMLRKKDIPMCIHCNSALIRFDEEYMDQYTGFWFLNSDNFQSAFRKIVTNTVQDFVSLGSMQKLNVRVLKKDIMKDNYLIFKSIFEKISFNNNESTTLANLRDTLLPKLMNGEIDLDSVEI